MNTGDFTYKIVIEEKTSSKDKFGLSNTWIEYKTLYASMKFNKSNKSIINDMLTVQKDLYFIVWNDENINENMRIKYKNQYYDFVIEPLGNFIKLNCIKTDGK